MIGEILFTNTSLAAKIDNMQCFGEKLVTNTSLAAKIDEIFINTRFAAIIGVSVKIYYFVRCSLHLNAHIKVKSIRN